MVNDIAVSTHMHPTSLGIVAEEDGEIFIGPDLVMKVVRYEDLLRANKTHPPKPIPIPSNSPIPSRVMDIKFTRGAVRAVVVTEHQNLGTQLEAFRTEFADCLIVKVCSHYSFSLAPRLPTNQLDSDPRLSDPVRSRVPTPALANCPRICTLPVLFRSRLSSHPGLYSTEVRLLEKPVGHRHHVLA